MLGMPPPGYSPMPMASGQSNQLLGNQQNQQQNNPQMMQMAMQLAGKGGFGGRPGQAGPTLGPVAQGPLGTPPPMPGGMMR